MAELVEESEVVALCESLLQTVAENSANQHKLDRLIATHGAGLLRQRTSAASRAWDLNDRAAALLRGARDADRKARLPDVKFDRDDLEDVTDALAELNERRAACQRKIDLLEGLGPGLRRLKRAHDWTHRVVLRFVISASMRDALYMVARIGVVLVMLAVALFTDYLAPGIQGVLDNAMPVLGPKSAVVVLFLLQLIVLDPPVSRMRQHLAISIRRNALGHFRRAVVERAEIDAAMRSMEQEISQLERALDLK